MPGHLLDVEVQRGVRGSGQKRVTGGVGPHLVQQLVECDHLPGPLAHPHRLAAYIEVNELIEDDLDAIKAKLGDYEIVVVPEDPAIVQADREGRAPIDTDPDAPAVKVLLDLAERLGSRPVAA